MHTQGELFQALLRTTYPTLLETQHLGFIQIFWERGLGRDHWPGASWYSPGNSNIGQHLRTMPSLLKTRVQSWVIHWHWMLQGNQATCLGLHVLTYKSVLGAILSEHLPVTEAVDGWLQSRALLQASRSQGAPRLMFLSALTREELGTSNIQNCYKLTVKLICLKWAQIENIYYHEIGKCHKLGLQLQQSPESCCSTQPRAVKSSPPPQVPANLEHTDREKCLSFLYSQF